MPDLSKPDVLQFRCGHLLSHLISVESAAQMVYGMLQALRECPRPVVGLALGISTLCLQLEQPCTLCLQLEQPCIELLDSARSLVCPRPLGARPSVGLFLYLGRWGLAHTAHAN
jgi:hypothetical protein